MGRTSWTEWNIVGGQKAVIFIGNCAESVDKMMKKILLHEAAQVDLQRKFEKICIDEHITALYAPRILATQTSAAAADTAVDTAAPDNNTDPSNRADPRQSFRKAVKKSQWQSLRKKTYEDPSLVKKDIANHLSNKAQRSQTMGARALEQLWSRDDHRSRHTEKYPTLEQVARSRSTTSDSFGGKSLSTNAALIKDYYNEVQQQRKRFSPLNSPRSPQHQTLMSQMNDKNPISYNEVDEFDENSPLTLKESRL